ncbi:hypothetical protein KIH74_04305 [Kineosporia sp. J2-2]|uniref:PPE family protein n=1 Tax=Kineosporia corallincola TaxID=2835133 RepID=A0ABS5TAP0_9ACTN|nr:hypothetical protein [Kineosporia corallincola]MBT0768130.1 hypothetical protein [Kineosporia corallincola]
MAEPDYSSGNNFGFTPDRWVKDDPRNGERFYSGTTSMYDLDNGKTDFHSMQIDLMAVIASNQRDGALRSSAAIWGRIADLIESLRSGLETAGNGMISGWDPAVTVAAANFYEHVGAGTWSLADWVTYARDNQTAVSQMAEQVLSAKKQMKTIYQSYLSEYNAKMKAADEAIDPQEALSLGTKSGSPYGVVGVGIGQEILKKNLIEEANDIRDRYTKQAADVMTKLADNYIANASAMDEGQTYQGPTESATPIGVLLKQLRSGGGGNGLSGLPGGGGVRNALADGSAARQRQLDAARKKAEEARRKAAEQLRKQKEELQKQLDQTKKPTDEGSSNPPKDLGDPLTSDELLNQGPGTSPQNQSATDTKNLGNPLTAEELLNQGGKSPAGATDPLNGAVPLTTRQLLASNPGNPGGQERSGTTNGNAPHFGNPAGFNTGGPGESGIGSGRPGGLSGVPGAGLPGAGGPGGLPTSGSPRSFGTGGGPGSAGSRQSLMGRLTSGGGPGGTGSGFPPGLGSRGGSAGGAPGGPGAGRPGQPGQNGRAGQGGPGGRGQGGQNGRRPGDPDEREPSATSYRADSEEYLGDVPNGPQQLLGAPRPPASFGQGPGPGLPGRTQRTRRSPEDELTGRRKKSILEDDELLSAPAERRPDLTGRRAFGDGEEPGKVETVGIGDLLRGGQAAPPVTTTERGRRPEAPVTEETGAEQYWEVDVPERIVAPQEQEAAERRGRALGPSS